MNLGNKIRELRRAGSLTQEQLAAALNISPQAVSKWEMGASYPDMTMIPIIASFFKVTLDELFDFDVKNVEKEIEEIRLEYGKYFWGNFVKAEQILLDGLKLYPASIRLKTELVELYAYNADRGDEIIHKAFELAGQIVQVSQDVFFTSIDTWRMSGDRITTRRSNRSLKRFRTCIPICCRTKCVFLPAVSKGKRA